MNQASDAPGTTGTAPPSRPGAPPVATPLPVTAPAPRTGPPGTAPRTEAPRTGPPVTPPRTGPDVTPLRTEAPGTAPAPRPTDPDDAERGEGGGFLARAALLTGVLTAAGALLGLLRDQTLAHLFGADRDTDAFLVAWTVPEFASTLLIEDGMALVLVPAFSVALARRTRGTSGPDPVRALVRASLPRLGLALSGIALLLVVMAPALVGALAPGLPDPELAVDCTRLTATCLLSFGLAGYCGAALRAHRSFLAPATIYVAYNVGIITTMLVLGGRWGVRSAAAGVAIGGLLMVLAQLPALWVRVRGSARPAPATGSQRPEDDGTGAGDRAVRLAGGALIASVLLFGVCRQSQVLIERFLGSSLPAGAISHLNYAQKVAQMPMVLSLMLCTVTFPVVARALAEGHTEKARRRVERDLTLAAAVVLIGAAAIVACAPQLVHVLFQRGAFTAADTAATAGVMRVYALGLLGHTLVGALVRTYFSAGRPTWYPLAAMSAGIAATAVLGALAVGPFGVRGIAAANATGITLAAVLLLCGTGPRSVPIHRRRVAAELTKTLVAAGCATGAALLCARWADAALPGVRGAAAAVAAAVLVVAVVFPLTLWPLRADALPRRPARASGPPDVAREPGPPDVTSPRSWTDRAREGGRRTARPPRTPRPVTRKRTDAR
ncbi:lipid II flippase MurJ [Streptomyces uncialis]|uniref:murein biosynthesis integral membrane protein MurJ n=1 Tax=Streptomyces uncialis TaxID=1048205 RepID=UPI00366273AB